MVRPVSGKVPLGFELRPPILVHRHGSAFLSVQLRLVTVIHDVSADLNHETVAERRICSQSAHQGAGHIDGGRALGVCLALARSGDGGAVHHHVRAKLGEASTQRFATAFRPVGEINLEGLHVARSPRRCSFSAISEAQGSDRGASCVLGRRRRESRKGVNQRSAKLAASAGDQNSRPACCRLLAHRANPGHEVERCSNSGPRARRWVVSEAFTLRALCCSG
mmetsp:Transcript_2656/g.8042  ORF Transcript_2656/g.8042 Transcript_2656/m.8042 type:complete len:222 (+) Transcript_2656:553-1218(+)